MNSIRFIGLDVHRQSGRACIRNSQNHIDEELNFGCTRPELESFARAHLRKTDHLALEATFHTWSIVEVLAPFVDKVVVSNPLATKAIAQSKIKTDKVDARVISELLRCDYLPEVWTPDADTRELRGMCSRRASLVSDLVRLKNRIHGVLAKALVPKYQGDLFDAKGRRWLIGVELPEIGRRQIDSDLRLLDLAQVELELHDCVLVKDAWNRPWVKLLMTMPGVDVTVALAVLAALGDPKRFPDGDHAASYLGIVPSTRQSGPHCYHGPITKHGNGKARWLVIQAAQHMAKNPGPLGVFFRRIERRKNRNVAVVATARKMVVIAWHMLTRNESYRYAQPKATQYKLTKFRVRATGAKRKTGPPKGRPQPTTMGTRIRTRSFPALAELYAQEGLPQAKSIENLKPAEKRMLDQLQLTKFVESIEEPQKESRIKPAPSPEPVGALACAKRRTPTKITRTADVDPSEQKAPSKTKEVS